MFGWIFDLIRIIRALIDLYNQYKVLKEAQRKAEELRRELELEKALDAAMKAKTPEEAFDAQDGIVNNSN